MKIAIVRGDFLSSWEIPNFQYLIKKHDVTFFLGKFPVSKVEIPPKAKVISLWSPADLNFGKVSRFRMAILNRLFVDAHVLFGLEEALKGFDAAYTAETFYSFTDQCLTAKNRGFVKRVYCHAGENIAFNNEGIWGRRSRKQRAIKEMDKFVAITEVARDVLLTEGCRPDKIVRAQPGVDLSLFHPCAVDKSKNVKLLFVGRLIEEKGIGDILKMFAKLRKISPKLELLVLGTGPLASLVHGAGVTYLAARDYRELPAIYSSADIYVHYSKGSKTWIEQYGFTLIEAMACGLPVVGLDRGSVREVVRDGGLVVSSEQYYQTLEKLVMSASLRRALSKKALTLARNRYDAYKYGQKLERIFQS